MNNLAIFTAIDCGRDRGVVVLSYPTLSDARQAAIKLRKYTLLPVRVLTYAKQ